jgi:hypothetical protein
MAFTAEIIGHTATFIPLQGPSRQQLRQKGGLSCTIVAFAARRAENSSKIAPYNQQHVEYKYIC